MNRTEKIIEKLEKYLSLVRYEYLEEEKLFRLKILQDYYLTDKIENIKVENYNTQFEVEEQLSKDLVLPLKVKGIMLTEGKPKNRFYPAEELEAAVKNPINKNFPLMLDHKDNEVAKIIGKVTRLEYDSNIKGIRWYGHINDETFARNVLDGIITEVSATIYATEELDEKYGKRAKNLTFKELSLVFSGAEPNNTIEVDAS